jgi:hypothetical protein
MIALWIAVGVLGVLGVVVCVRVALRRTLCAVGLHQWRPVPRVDYTLPILLDPLDQYCDRCPATRTVWYT